MTMPHLENCAHSDDGWCLNCVKQLHDEGEERADTLEKLLSDVGFFETTADPGPGREVEDVSVRLWCDGSGELLVKTSVATAEPGVERMLNRVFNTETARPFGSVDELLAMLSDMQLLTAAHPECEE